MVNMKIFTVFITFAFVSIQLVLCDNGSNYCYSDDEDPYFLFGTKTAYHFTHGLIENSTVPNCKPVQIWMIIRHGTRNPSGKDIKNMKHNLPDIQHDIIKNHEKHERGSLCKKDLKNIKKWELNKKLLKNGKDFLTEQGKEELKLLGRRFKHYFPDLIRVDSADALTKKYRFRSTDTKRTIASMKNFIEGAFDNAPIKNTIVVPTPADTLLKLYKTCQNYIDEKNSPSNNEETNVFKNSPRYDSIISGVSERLGFRHNLTLDDIMAMYTACTFEKAWNVDKVSPWCAIFTRDELKVFQYETDLHYYYNTGYGGEINSKVGCPPLQDMFNHFTKLENGDADEEQGIFYFSHSSALQLLFTAMGIAEDSIPLKASNFESMENRRWNTSELVPFAANLAAVFYKCESMNKVRLYLNEKPLEYEGCDMGVCDWDYLKKKLEPIASSCSVDVCTK